MVSLLTTLVSFPKVMLRRQVRRARWTSPDRGIKSRRHHDHHHAPVPRRLPVRPAAHGRRLVRLVYLFGAGILAILRGPPAGPRSRCGRCSCPANTLWGYAALALANGAALVAWALQPPALRRQGPPPPGGAVGDAQLARSFTVAPAQLQQLRRARVAVIHHGDGGEIIGIEPARAQLRSVA